MAIFDREQILNVPNESINRGDLNPDTLIRRIIPGTGMMLAGTGVGDETIHAASPTMIWAEPHTFTLRDGVEWIAASTTAARFMMAGVTFMVMDIDTVPIVGGASIFRMTLGENVGFYGDDNDYLYYNRSLNAWMMEVDNAEEHYFGVDTYAMKRVSGNVRVGIRKTGTTSKMQFRDEETAQWLDLDNFVLNTRMLTAGSGLTGGGTLSGDRTFHVGAGTGIATNINAVYAASPSIWWHANAATPSIHEIHPTTAGTARFGYCATDSRWYWGTGERENIVEVDASTMTVSASYGIRLAGPSLRILSFDTGNDHLLYDTANDVYIFHVGGATTVSIAASNLRVAGGAPRMEFRETAAALPNGLYRYLVNADNMYFQKNTAAAGDFSTLEWFLTLYADGNIGVNKNVPAAQLHVDQSSATGAKPVLTLDQADIDQEIIKIIATGSTDGLDLSLAHIDAVTTATLFAYARVNVQDDGNGIADQDYFMPLYTLA